MKPDTTNGILPDFDSIKDSNETILWMDKPKLIPFILKGSFWGLFFIVFGITFLTIVLTNKSEKSASDNFIGIVVGIFTIVYICWNFIKRILSYRNTFYAFSDKRIMIRSGFAGPGFKIISYDKIIDVEVNVGVIERKYGAGTIYFFSGRTEKDDEGVVKIHDKWESIPNCYDVFRRVKQIISLQVGVLTGLNNN